MRTTIEATTTTSRAAKRLDNAIGWFDHRRRPIATLSRIPRLRRSAFLLRKPKIQILFVVLLLPLEVWLTWAAIPCNDTATCERLIRPGSICIPNIDSSSNTSSICSNPFVSGCLQNYLGSHQFPHKRICGSHDDDKTTICDPPTLDSYEEIRILYQDWDSTLLTSWVMQIFLSEVVRVPVSLESSSPNVVANFYDPYNRFQYSPHAYDWDALRVAQQVGDCRLLSKNDNNLEDYKSCAHVMPEIWSGQRANYLQSEQEGWTEAAESTGGVAKYSWYIPRFVAEMDPTLLSYFGLRGEANRQKLAETFLRPTTWKDYCTLISPTGCKHDNLFFNEDNNSTQQIIATRPPATEEEGERYYVEGEYWGYFRKTKEGDCDLYPHNCTGHIANVPCSWSTFVVPQAYYNDIHVKSNGPTPNGGYPYLRMQEIWYAANHSKSPVLFYWFTPDPLIQDLVGTPAEVQEILLPPPTQECVDTRVSPQDRCSSSLEIQLGSSTGACDAEAHSLHKVLVANLRERLVTSQSPEEINPAYEAVREFRISDLEMATIFENWYDRGIDKWGYDPRHAACHWVANNLEDLQRFVPNTFPRELRDLETHKDLLHRSALAVGIVVCSLTVATTVAVIKWRSKTVMRHAQVIFLLLILGGLFLVSVGAILLSAEPTTATCVSFTWFVLLGYTLEMIPLIVKTAAIQTLFKASRKMRRVKLARKDLFGTVAFVVVLVVIYLICMTIIDPPTQQKQLMLTDDNNKTTQNGWYQVDVSYYCASNNIIWTYVAVGWQVLLLLLAVVLAVQTRGVVSEFNESRRLGLMVYSHFFFVALRIIILALYDTISNSRLQAFQSLANSGESLATLLIYFAPMFHAIFIKDDGRPGKQQLPSYFFAAALQRSIKRSFENHRFSVTGGAVAIYETEGEAKTEEAASRIDDDEGDYPDGEFPVSLKDEKAVAEHNPRVSVAANFGAESAALDLAVWSSDDDLEEDRSSNNEEEEKDAGPSELLTFKTLAELERETNGRRSISQRKMHPTTGADGGPPPLLARALTR